MIQTPALFYHPHLLLELHDHERKEESQLPPDGEVPGPRAARAGDLLSPPHYQGPRLQVADVYSISNKGRVL